MRIIAISLGFLAGIVIGAELPDHLARAWDWQLLVWWWLMWLLALVVLLKFSRHEKLPHLILASLAGVVAFGYAAEVHHRRQTMRAPAGETVTMTGRVSTFPEIVGREQRFIVRVDSLPEPIRIQIETGREPPFLRDEEVHMIGRLSFPPTGGTFDYRRYLEGQGVAALMVRPESIVEQNPPRMLWSAVNRLRNHIRYQLERWLSEPAASLALGLTLGIPPKIDPDLSVAFEKTNLTHLAAVSGQNLALTVLLIYKLIRRVWLRAAIVTTFLLLATYIGLVGAEPSITRAAVLVAAFLCQPLLGRRAEPIRLLLLTASVMAVFNPFVITRDVGFQLSFAAFAGILLVSPIIERWLHRLPGWLAETLATIGAATLAVLPIQLAVFGTMSPIGPLANLLVAAVVPFAMLSALVFGLIGGLLGPLAATAALVVYIPLDYLASLARSLGELPGAAHQFPLSTAVRAALVAAEGMVFLLIAKWYLVRPGLRARRIDDG